MTGTLTRFNSFVSRCNLHVELLKPILALGYFPALDMGISVCV
jgi:hypothetical protein